jgi:hypothetical protein
MKSYDFCWQCLVELFDVSYRAKGENRMSRADKLRDLWKDRETGKLRCSQIKLGKIIGKDYRQVQRYLAGADIPMDVAEKLIIHFKLPINYFYESNELSGPDVLPKPLPEILLHAQEVLNSGGDLVMPMVAEINNLYRLYREYQAAITRNAIPIIKRSDRIEYHPSEGRQISHIKKSDN